MKDVIQCSRIWDTNVVITTGSFMDLYIDEIDPSSEFQFSVVSFYMLCFPRQQGNQTSLVLFVI